MAEADAEAAAEAAAGEELVRLQKENAELAQLLFEQEQGRAQALEAEADAEAQWARVGASSRSATSGESEASGALRAADTDSLSNSSTLSASSASDESSSETNATSESDEDSGSDVRATVAAESIRADVVSSAAGSAAGAARRPSAADGSARIDATTLGARIAADTRQTRSGMLALSVHSVVGLLKRRVAERGGVVERSRCRAVLPRSDVAVRVTVTHGHAAALGGRDGTPVLSRTITGSAATFVDEAAPPSWFGADALFEFVVHDSERSVLSIELLDDGTVVGFVEVAVDGVCVGGGAKALASHRTLLLNTWDRGGARGAGRDASTTARATSDTRAGTVRRPARAPVCAPLRAARCGSVAARSPPPRLDSAPLRFLPTMQLCQRQCLELRVSVAFDATAVPAAPLAKQLGALLERVAASPWGAAALNFARRCPDALQREHLAIAAQQRLQPSEVEAHIGAHVRVLREHEVRRVPAALRL